MSIDLNFKKWAESIFGQGIMDDPEPASEIPMWLNKIQNGAFPSYDVPESDPLMANIKKRLKDKKMKKR
jgi:hypothetical protein